MTATLINTGQMKLPKNQSSRLSIDVWILGEALRRHYRATNIRDGFEAAIRITADRLASESDEFAGILKDVKDEGIEDS